MREPPPTPIKSEQDEMGFIKRLSFQKGFVYLQEVITLEPLVVCYIIAKSMIDPALKSLELEKACRVNSQFNHTICDDILSGTFAQNNFTRENNIVQSHITAMHSWQLTTTNALAIIIMLLLGSFSDRYKIRKPFILLTLFGQILAISGCILCVYFMDEWPLEVQGFLQEVVYAMFGGEKMLIMIIYAYIADVSNPHKRTIRMSMVQAIWNICYTLGQTIGGNLCCITNYLVIFGTALILFTLAFFYGLFMIKESRKSVENNDSRKMVLDAFNPRYILETFKLFTRYKGRFRINIISILILQYIYSTVSNGEHSVLFLYTQMVYEWTVTTYSWLYSFIAIGNAFSLFVIVPLIAKVFKLDDLIFIILASTSKILSNTIIVIIRSPIGLYIGCAVGMVKAVALVGIRSQLTKNVSEDDVGKVLSMACVVNSFGEGVTSQIYNNGIYEHTRETFPQAFLLLGIGLHILGIIIVMWLLVRKNLQAREDTKSSSTVDVKQHNIALETEITSL